MFLFEAVLTAPLSVWKKTAADKWAYQTRHVFLFLFLMRRRMHIENCVWNFRILFHFDSQFGRVSINEWFQFIPGAGKDIVVINWLDFFPVPLLQWWLVWIVSSINLLKTQNEPFRISPVGKDNQDIPILHQRQFEGNTILHGMSSFGLHSVMGNAHGSQEASKLVFFQQMVRVLEACDSNRARRVAFLSDPAGRYCTCPCLQKY